MRSDVASFIALIGITGMVAVILVIAWREFGRPRHALTWAVGFAFAGATWTTQFAATLAGSAGPSPLALIFAGFASTVNTLGFRQRSGGEEWRGRLLGAAGAHVVAVVALVAMGSAPYLRVMPLDLLEAVMFLNAARTLTGRRRSERIAERLAATVLILLAGLNGCAFLGRLAIAAAIIHVDPMITSATWLSVLPAVVTGIGLFTIFLLAADLADQTRRLASIDMLTGLLNRRGFEETAGAIMSSARRNGRSMALVLVDIDRFKTINDRFGHPAGDRVLSAFAQCLLAGVGRRDVVARLGGEEFALILTDVDGAAAECAAEVLRTTISALRVTPVAPAGITASFGVCPLQTDGDSLTRWLASADAALYRSKAGGRNRVTLAA